ncbi:hypothetical protein ACSS7Z_03890 [Microbacterium sp. A82]|uniref:hypothetical protein n=1 Tax=unclassified Microbacterium TaxID=2609290 RepID=UPI003F3E5B82
MLRLIRRSRFLLGAVAAAALVVLTSTATSALSARADDTSLASSASQVAWSMTPVITDVGEERSNFAYALDPGARVDDAVLVRNSGATALDLAVHGSDAFTDGTGALDIATESVADGVSAWISPAVDTVHIAPGELVRIPFSVAVPADAQPGEHAAALLTVLASAGETVSVDMRYATRVTVTVAGELTAGLSLDQAQLEVTTGFWPWESASADVSYAVGNTGNTRLTAMQLITAPGVELYSSPDASTGLLSLAELLPAAAVDVQATVDGLSAWSPFTAVEVSVSPTVIATTASAEIPTIAQQQLSLSALAIAPGWWVILAAVLLLIIVAVRVAVRRRVIPPRTPR